MQFIFFHTHLDINCDQEIGGVFLYNFNKYDDNKLDDAITSLNTEPEYCLAKIIEHQW